MKKLLLPFLMILSVVTTLAQTVSISPSNSNIQYAGRMSFDNPDAPAFSMPGTSITVSFNGTGIEANFTSSGTSYIYIIVDGDDNPYERSVVPVSGNNVTVPLASGLQDGNHTVKIVKSNEYDTKLTFKGLSISGAGILSPPVRLPYKIEYYGDSNPSGWGAWDVRDEGHSELSGAYHTYPGLTARMLNAEYSNFSAGGWGTTPKTRKMNVNDTYDRIHIGDRASSSNTWDFANNYWNFMPDVVVINLGANDYYNGATEEEIKAGWEQLVSSIRQHCSQSHIVMANSYGWAINEPADYVHEFVESRHSMGDNNISFVRFPWLWSDYHAVINEHAGFANILASHIADVMGWSTPTLSPLSSFGQNGNFGNGSFESSLIDGFADGWRPFATYSTPEYITDQASAYDGESYIRCADPSGVMHANDAAPGDVFEVSVWMKASQGSKGRLKYEFRDQGQGHLLVDMVDVTIGSTWEQVNLTTQAAPIGTWQINVILEGIEGSTVDFDLAEMQKVTGGTIPVSGVSVSPSTVNLLISENIQLNETVSPANATDKSVSWSSSNNTVAAVDANGLVQAQAEGTATISVTTNDGGYVASCQVSVSSGSGGATTMHVIDIIEGVQAAGGPNNNATATVYILDDLGNPVANATVSGTFSGDFNETKTGTTGAEGSVTIVTSGKKKGTPSINFCVDNVTHNNLTYSSDDNVITCSDNGLKSIQKSGLDIDNVSSITIYPNPVTNSNLNIKFGTHNTGSKVEIYDGLGKLKILKQNINQTKISIDVSNFDKGIYFIKASNNSGVINKKIVIK